MSSNQPPTRRSIATALTIALICAGSAALAAHRGDHWWAALGIFATALLTREALLDLAERRHHHRNSQ